MGCANERDGRNRLSLIDYKSFETLHFKGKKSASRAKNYVLS